MRSLKVLIVEDHADTAEMRSHWAQKAGFAVKLCRPGFQALQAATAFRPDVILLDLGLPDIDGWELARQLKAEPVVSGSLIIAVSAYQTTADKLRSEQAGIAYHLGKPVHQAELLGLLAQAAG
jgi:two-component system CheB/CheR fusion protein